jgi:gliding motility-associated protein GldE
MSAMISGSEIAYFSLGPNELDKIKEEGTPSGKRIFELKSKPRMLLATILVGNNLINIAIIIISDIVVRKYLDEGSYSALSHWVFDTFGFSSVESISRGIEFLFTVIGVTFLLVLFGEVTPKIYANLNNIGLAKRMSKPLMILRTLFYPISLLLVKWSSRMEDRLSRNQARSSSKEDLDHAIDLAVASSEDSSQKEIDILKGIVNFKDIVVKQIMQSRVDVTTIDSKASYKTLLNVIKDSGFSRIPVIDNEFDNVKGILYVKDLLKHLEKSKYKWAKHIRTDIIYVPESKLISELLREFQKERNHMAIVVDEFGGSSGIVTLEDIMEEVIGEIIDEFDEIEEIEYTKVDENTFIFEGKTMLNDVCRIIGISTNAFDNARGDSDSLAGLVLELLGHLPKRGKEINYKNFSLKILSVGKKRIEKIQITIKHEEVL